MKALESYLQAHNQQHLIAEVQSYSDEQKASFLKQLETIPWESLRAIAADKNANDIDTSRVIGVEEQAKRLAELLEEGLKAYSLEDVAVLMVAGGQGSRLGFSGPKGCYSIGAVSNKSVYQIQSEKVLAMSRQIEKDVPFLIMTSPATDVETKSFFAENGNFGLKDSQVHFFSQATVPSLDKEGALLLKEEAKLLDNPDGHGGCFTALCNSGLLERLRKEGIEHLLYMQVDNILAPVFDPILLGLARVEKAEVITKVVEKTKPEEKVGLLLKIDGVDGILEYISFTPEQLAETDDSGKLKYRWGNTAMHYWNVDFLLRKFDEGFQLPLHRSKKPLLSFVNGQSVEVEGYKHERFIFDLIPQASVSLGLEILRENEFAPLKNAEGVDSPETVNRLSTAKFSTWLEKAGTRVSEGIKVEISPLFALTEAEFRSKWKPGSEGYLEKIEKDTYIS